jgi:hypothetical protein
MYAWLLRSVGLGVLTVVLRTLLGFAMIYWPTHGQWLRIGCLVILIGAGVVWGIFDGRADRKTYPDPDEGVDLTMRWLKAGIAGGLGSGLLAWLLGFVPTFDLSGNSLFFELTVSAAFIVLMIFVPAMVGVTAGRFLADRAQRKAEAHSSAEEPAPVG